MYNRLQDIVSLLVLKVVSLNLLAVLRELIPEDVALTLLPSAIGLLKSQSKVIHIYSIVFIDKLISEKDPIQDGGNITLDSFLLLNNLIEGLKSHELQENPYIMK